VADSATGRPQELSKTQAEKQRKRRQKAHIAVEHIDLIKDQFWEERPWILSGEAKARGSQ
jgi:tRNA(His) guanylyltransferase